MNTLKNLLNKLNAIEPLSKEYRNDLIHALSREKKENNYYFLKPGQLAEKVWNIVSGFILVFGNDEDGTNWVMDIYGPGALVTDLLSFIENEPVTFSFIAIGKVEVLELTKEDYLKLNQYPESAVLLQALTFLTLKNERAKKKLQLLSQKAKVIWFSRNYNTMGLSDKYCASFLGISIEKYIELKVVLLKSGDFEPWQKLTGHKNYIHKVQLVDEVKSYLLANYTDPNFKDVTKIAQQFNTTKKTLTRSFSKILGVTVHKHLLTLRMEKAMSLLLNEKLRVKDIYNLVGYKDVYHFSKAFKQYFGSSAKEILALPKH